MKPIKDLDFWSSLVIIFIIIYLMIATYLRWFQLHVLVGPFFIDHWFVWIGTLYIAFVLPIFYVSKRRYPKRLTTLIRIHAFGNLFAFMLISVHFAQQIGRPPQFYPDLGTGLTLYIVMFILTVTGFLHRFRIIRSVRPHLNRFLHVSITMSFYLIIGIHTLEGLKIL
ncbi:MAG: hypothetical protein NWE86_06155 [Candidatus Bathyarchaeota archaeon]|nr:hypothetical protein [Candidatus Bathyarchaeota archaeon]